MKISLLPNSHPNSYQLAPEFLSGVKQQGVKLITHPHLAPRPSYISSLPVEGEQGKQYLLPLLKFINFLANRHEESGTCMLYMLPTLPMFL
jgi:hypothetical protein